MRSDVFPYENMKSICFICCRKRSTWQNRVAKAKPHLTTSLTFLSHLHFTVIYLLKFRFIFAFFWSLLFFFWVVFLNSCRRSCCENRKSQLTTTTICSPCSFFSSFRVLKNACLRSVIHQVFSVMQELPGWTGKELVGGLFLKIKMSLLKRKLHLLTIFLKEDFVFYLL